MLKKSIFILITILLVFSGCTRENDGRVSIVLGTAGTAGTYFILGAAMSETVNKYSDFLHVTAQPTRGSIENINLTNAGELQFGMSNSDGVYWAITGTGMFEGRPQNISVVMTLYHSSGQMSVRRDSGINSWADLRGRRVVLGPAGTTIIAMSQAILRAYGIDPDTDITPFFLPFDQGLAELQDGNVDASFLVGGAPVAAITNAKITGAIKLLGVSQDVIDRIYSEYAYFSPHVIPIGTYSGMDSDVSTLKIMTEIFANNNVPEEVVYEFLRQTLENIDDFIGSHVVAQEINIETAASSVSRYHPGALRFFRERGVLP